MRNGGNGSVRRRSGTVGQRNGGGGTVGAYVGAWEWVGGCRGTLSAEAALVLLRGMNKMACE